MCIWTLPGDSQLPVHWATLATHSHTYGITTQNNFLEQSLEMGLSLLHSAGFSINGGLPLFSKTWSGPWIKKAIKILNHNMKQFKGIFKHLSTYRVRGVLLTPCLAMAIQLWMEWIPIKEKSTDNWLAQKPIVVLSILPSDHKLQLVWTPSFCWGGWALNQIFKKVGVWHALTGSRFLEGGCWERERRLFSGGIAVFT